VIRQYAKKLVQLYPEKSCPITFGASLNLTVWVILTSLGLKAVATPPLLLRTTCKLSLTPNLGLLSQEKLNNTPKKREKICIPECSGAGA